MNTVVDTSFRRAMAPSRAEIAALDLSANSKIVQQLLGGTSAERRRSALDIGCGNGKFTRLLASLFRSVAGIDVKARKIEEAQQAARDAGLAIDFRTASADAIPFPDASFDVVAFSNSLHHMPDPRRALAEAARVLRPGGWLYVMEPVPAGNYHDAISLVNDETPVRTEAYRQVTRLEGFTALQEILYRSHRTFASVDEWLAGQVDQDPARKARFDAQPDEVRRRFETNAQREDGRLGFDQVFRVNLLEKAA